MGIYPLANSVKALLHHATYTSHWCACSHTFSLLLDHLSTTGASVGVAFQGNTGRNTGGWFKKHLKGVRLVANWCKEFWSYLAKEWNVVHSLWFSVQYTLINHTTTWMAHCWPGHGNPMSCLRGLSFSIKPAQMCNVNCAPLFIHNILGDANISYILCHK